MGQGPEFEGQLDADLVRDEIRHAQALPPDLFTTGRFRRRLRSLIVAVALVAVCITVLVVSGLAGDETHESSTADPAAAAQGANASPTVLHVSDGSVTAVVSAFGRLWVVTRSDETTPGSSLLRSYGAATGTQLSEQRVDGQVYAMVATSSAVWLRATTGGPSSFPIGQGGLGDNAIYRVDRNAGDPTPIVFLNGDGPLAAAPNQVAVADRLHVEVLDPTGAPVWSRAIDDVAPTLPGTNGITGLAFTEVGGSSTLLYALHQGRSELLAFDGSGDPVVRTSVSDLGSGVGPRIAATDGQVWVDTRKAGTVALNVAGPTATSTVAPSVRVELVADAGGSAALVLDEQARAALAQSTGSAVQFVDVDDHRIAQWDPQSIRDTTVTITTL